jgi:hypothetical protein
MFFIRNAVERWWGPVVDGLSRRRIRSGEQAGGVSRELGTAAQFFSSVSSSFL